MKHFINTFILAVSIVALQASSLTAQKTDSLGLPGDNFSLQGALDIFKNSKSLEEFEEKLNKEDNYINNLDLNEDGEIDYIRVEDNMEGNVHAIVLQAPINEKEAQDIAVIEIEKTGEETAILQIVGDEDLYGENYIVEPFEEEATSDGKGPNANYRIARIVVNVWFWSPVRVIYSPGYRVYVSPWRWAYYPTWWRPWRPHPYRWHWNKRSHYHVHYRPVTVHRVPRAHVVYTPKRKTSTTVRTSTVSKRTTVSKTTSVRSASGNKTAVASKTTGKKATANGNTTVGKRSATQVGAKKDADGKVTVGKRTATQKGVKGQKGSKKVTKTKSTKVSKKKNKTTVKKTKTKKVKKKKNN